jgi:hypothetical protein
LYVGITTLPSRIALIRPTLDSLLAQQRRPERVFLSLPKQSVRERSGYTLPRFLATPRYSVVEVVRSDVDFGPATRLLGCLHLIADPAVLILVDDDLAYRPYVLDSLYRAQSNDRSASFSYCVYKIGRFSIAQGADGFSFFTPNLVGIETFASVALRSPALFVLDDHWVSCFLLNKRIAIKALKPPAGETRVYEETHAVRQLRHLDGELERWTAIRSGGRHLVRCGVLGPRLRLDYYVTWLRALMYSLRLGVTARLKAKLQPRGGRLHSG